MAPPLARPEDPAPLGGLLADALGAGLRALELLLLNLYLAVQVYLPPLAVGSPMRSLISAS